MASDVLDLQFPVGGLNKRTGLQRQAPYTTPDCSNVRPLTGADRRARGGTRPGLSKVNATQFGTSGSDRPFQFITSVAAINDTRGFFDPFNGASIGSNWNLSTPSNYPSIGSGTLSNNSVNPSSLGSDQLPLPGDGEYSVTISVKAANSLRYMIAGRVGSPGGYADNSMLVTISFGATYEVGGGYTITVQEYHSGAGTVIATTGYIDGSPGDGEFKVVFTGNGNAEVDIYWKSSLLETRDAGTPFGSSHAIEIDLRQSVGAVVAAEVRECTVSWEDQGDRVRNIWTCQGNLYVERSGYVRTFLSQYTSDSRWIAHTNYRGNLYTVGNQGLIYDYIKDYPTDWTVTDGTLPTANILATWGDRIVAAAGHIVYMSRVADPLDWDYAANEYDTARAFAFTTGETASSGEWITALIPASSDVLFIAKSRSIWAVLGNPAGSGQVINVSRNIGILNPHAWTRTPDGTIYFMSYDGLYMLPGGAPSSPVPLLRDTNPQILPDPDTETSTVVYDHHAEGVHILNIEIGNTVYDYFYHVPTNSIWPFAIPASMAMRSIGGAASVDTVNAVGSRVWIGCKDGYIRRFDDAATNDDGTTLSSYVFMGPIGLGNSLSDGRVDEINAVLGESSGNVTWSIHPGDTGYEALNASALHSGTWVAGDNYTSRAKTRSAMACVKLSGTAKWSLEEATLIRTKGGRSR